MSDISSYIDEADPIHLNAKGIEVCASQVAEYIRDAARTIGQGESCVDDSHVDMTGAPVLI